LSNSSLGSSEIVSFVSMLLQMTFVQALTGGGGWPMSVWLTPGELKPFYGGTYYPGVDARHDCVQMNCYITIGAGLTPEMEACAAFDKLAGDSSSG
jgi:hypothetical protein